MTHLEFARELFARDLYATECTGAVIEAAEPGHSVCTLAVEAKHRNAGGTVMGGAIFTLADFAFAVASNQDHSPTVALDVNIHFLSAVKGERLIAAARCVKSGRTTGVYEITLTDDLGKTVALFVGTGYKL